MSLPAAPGRILLVDDDPMIVRLVQKILAAKGIAEVVHDIDMKDAKYDRPDTAGVETLLTGIARSTPSDEERIEHGGALFTALYASLRGTELDTSRRMAEG